MLPTAFFELRQLVADSINRGKSKERLELIWVYARRVFDELADFLLPRVLATIVSMLTHSVSSKRAAAHGASSSTLSVVFVITPRVLDELFARFVLHVGICLPRSERRFRLLYRRQQQ